MSKSKLVTLNLPSETLKQFPVEFTPKKRRKSSTANSTQPAPLATPTPVKKESNLDTPIPNSRATTPSGLEDGRRKARGGRGGSKSGKRSLLSSPAPEGAKQEPSATTSTTATTNTTGTGTGTGTGAASTPNVKSTLSKSITSTTASNSGSNTNGDDDKLDKTGQPARTWVKKAIEITSFTGYNIEFKGWNGESKEGEETIVKQQDDDKETHGKTPFKVQIKLNNKKLNVDEPNGGEDSRDQSPALPDDASSIVTTPEGSNAMTPIP